MQQQETLHDQSMSLHTNEHAIAQQMPCSVTESDPVWKSDHGCSCNAGHHRSSLLAHNSQSYFQLLKCSLDTLLCDGTQQKHCCFKYKHGNDAQTCQDKGNSSEQAAHLAKIIQVDSIISRAKRHQVAVGWAELHAAHICLAVNAGDSAVVRNAPQPDCAIITATQKPGWIGLQDTHQGDQHTLLP